MNVSNCREGVVYNLVRAGVSHVAQLYQYISVASHLSVLWSSPAAVIQVIVNCFTKAKALYVSSSATSTIAAVSVSKNSTKMAAVVNRKITTNLCACRI